MFNWLKIKVLLFVTILGLQFFPLKKMMRRGNRWRDYDVVASLVAGETLISDDVLSATVGEGKVGKEDSEDESHIYK